MIEQWQELKETITEMRDNNGTGTQQEVCKFLANLMDVLEKQIQKPCEDTISRQYLLDNCVIDKVTMPYVPISKIQKAPPVVSQLKTGHWISDLKLYGYGKDNYQCSICGRTIHLCRPQEQLTDYPYCHCGAKMIEPQESEDEK